MQFESQTTPHLQKEISRLRQMIREQEREIMRLRMMVNYKPDLDRLVPMSVDGILLKVCEFFKIGYTELIEKNRQAERVVARMAAAHIACKVYGHTFKSVGIKLGHRDHTTMMNACDRASEYMATNKAFARHINIIIQNIENEFVPVSIGGCDAHS
jgi:chromosomal replication initiation ATPase DnaA